MGGAPNTEVHVIELTVNGKPRQIDGPTDLPVYLATLGVNLQLIAVAYNGTVVRRTDLDKITLSEGDRVEIVRAVGGG